MMQSVANSDLREAVSAVVFPARGRSEPDELKDPDEVLGGVSRYVHALGHFNPTSGVRWCGKCFREVECVGDGGEPVKGPDGQALTEFFPLGCQDRVFCPRCADAYHRALGGGGGYDVSWYFGWS